MASSFASKKAHRFLAGVFFVMTFLLVTSVCIPDEAHAASRKSTYDNLVSAYGGLFAPSGDYPTGYDPLGLSLGVSVIRIDEYAGFEFGFTGYYLDDPSTSSSALVYGTEFLVHFQKEERYIQPYFALGIGVYVNDVSTVIGNVKDTGSGMILKAGVRYFVDDKYFWGVFLKHFSNQVELNYYLSDVNMGGDCLCFEMGFWTD